MANRQGKWLVQSLLKATAATVIKNIWLGPISGLEYVPRNGSAVLIANHNSYMDFLVTGTVCELLAKRPVHFWANRKITELHPLFRHLASICEAIPVDRRTYSGNSWKHSIQLLGQGRLLGIFPEGTRSRNGKLQPFHPGYLKLASKAGVPIVPVYLDGAYEVWPPHQRWPKFDRKCAITIYPSVSVPPDLSKPAIMEFNWIIAEKYYVSRKAAKVTA